MLNLPQSTEYNKLAPKKKFYEHLAISSDLKKVFVEQIKSIRWRNIIAPRSVNLEAGKEVTEIHVFEVQLNEKNLNEDALRIIDQGIPYHIVFVLHYGDEIQIWTAYKEATPQGVYKVRRYFHTDWILEDQFSFELKGINLDQVYENLVRSIAGDELDTNPEETLQQSIEKAELINKLDAKINKLQTKMRKEKQFNKKVKFNDEIKALKAELSKIQNG